jgi:hypothetical protein
MREDINLHTELAAVIRVAEGLARDVRHQIPSGLRLFMGTRRLTVLRMEGQLILFVQALARNRVPPNVTV